MLLESAVPAVLLDHGERILCYMSQGARDPRLTVTTNSTIMPIRHYRRRGESDRSFVAYNS